MDLLQGQLEIASDKIQMLKDARGKDSKDASKKLEEARTKNTGLQ